MLDITCIVLLMASQIANFVSCLGVYDSTLQGTGFAMDVSGLIGTSDLSLNTGYLSNTTAFVMPSATNGRGISFTGWFNPIGNQPSSYTPIFDVSCGPTNSSIILTVSGDTITNNPFLVGSYTVNGTTITISTPSAQVLSDAWNFFSYTLCCSGSTLVQNLYVNNNTTSLTSGTYSAMTFSQTMLGYGFGNFANYYNGKIDDFRYYARVITPMEIRVLNSFNYGNINVATLVPSLGTITFTPGLPTSIPFVFSNTGTYSYLQYRRIGNNGTASSGTLSPSVMSASGQSYTWSDTTVVPAVTYLYTWTPYILGTPGIPSGVQSIYTLAPATVFTGFSASAFTPTNGVGGYTGLTLNWTGGTGTSINYLYYINNTPITANYTGSGSSQILTFTALTAPTSGTTPTPYAWYVDICANNLAGTTHGIYTVYAPPTTLVLSSSYASNNVTLTWTGGLAGNTVNFYYYITSGTGTQSSAPITSPTVVAVTGSGPWIFDVSATNTSGTTYALTTSTQAKMIIGTVTTMQAGDVTSTVTSNSLVYNYYILKTVGSYTINYTSLSSSTVYALIVGGGGSGGTSWGGGGGAGGVAMSSFTVPVSGSNQTITVVVGAGGTPVTNNIPVNGSNSSVVFNGTGGNAVTPSSITAVGGGQGGNGYSGTLVGTTGGSAGGNGSAQSTGTTTGGTAGNTNTGINYANAGGGNNYGSGNTNYYTSGGGGGGAGAVGQTPNGTGGGNGGNGIQPITTLYGIKDIPNYGTYYYGGGGGGYSYYVNTGNGGQGGGGGGSGQAQGGSAGTGGTSGVNTGGNGIGGNNSATGGNGGANTGSGGGGNNGGTTGGNGGSGIVIIAFPQ